MTDVRTLLTTPILSAILLLAAHGHIFCADAPTTEEWAPVETALNDKSPTAEKQLADLVAAYPRWADGQRALAEWRLENGKAELALADAQAALAISPNDAGAASLMVQALGKVGKLKEAFILAEKFVGDKDPGGWVNFRAAEVAFNAGDQQKATLHLSLASGRTKTLPPEFAFLDARISEAGGDLDRAEVSLNRAIAAKPRFWTAFYQLGVVNLRQAESKTTGSRIEYLKKSEGNFKQVTDVVTKDALAWLGLGRAQLTLAQEYLIDDHESGLAKAREAERSLNNAIEIDKDLRDAHLNLGVTYLINDKPEQAITHLLRARDLGDTNRTIGFNLMLAYQKLGRTAEFESEAANVQAVSTAEKITAGIGFFKAGNYALAIKLITSSIEGLGDDRERVSAAYRFIGHAEAAIAEQLASKQPGDEEAYNTHLDNAREAWRKSGNFRDYVAQRFFIGQESQRSPQLAYNAGWQHLRWHDYQSLDGWKLVLGNYGGAVTGGKGFAGMWEKNPVHVIVWGVLGIIPLCLALFSWLRPKRVHEEYEEYEDERPERPVRQAPPRQQPAPKAVAPPQQQKHKPRNPGQGVREKPVAHRSPAPPTRPPAAKPVPTPRKPTPKPQVRSHIETEPTLRPIRDPRAGQQQETKQPPSSKTLKPNVAIERKRTEPETNAALERRSPRPDSQK